MIWYWVLYTRRNQLFWHVKFNLELFLMSYMLDEKPKNGNYRKIKFFAELLPFFFAKISQIGNFAKNCPNRRIVYSNANLFIIFFFIIRQHTVLWKQNWKKRKNRTRNAQSLTFIYRFFFYLLRFLVDFWNSAKLIFSECWYIKTVTYGTF